MVKDIARAEKTQRDIEKFINSPSSVLILHGMPGVGKQKAAEEILTQLLPIQDALGNYPYLVHIQPEKDSISIDAIRQMQTALVRSVPGNQAIRRAVLITNAKQLTPEAQNALLKSLEEPPVDTVFIMCVDNLQSLLSTVVSRAQTLPVLPITESISLELFGDSPEVHKAYLMSGGRAELLAAILDNTDHPLLSSINQAKEILQQSTYERLLRVNEISKDRVVTGDLLQALQLVAHVSLATAVQAEKFDSAKRWQQIERRASDAQRDLQGNAGAKLVLTDLFLHL